MRLPAILIGALLSSALGIWAADMPPVTIDYFYEAGCPDCLKVRQQVLPELQERFEGFYDLNLHDLNERTNVMLLVAYQKKLPMTENKPVSMVVDYTQPLNGFEVIHTGLLDQVNIAVSARMEAGWTAPQPIQAESDGQAVEERVRSFTLAMVLIAGLTDGINPCAIATLVFFMSLLAVAKVRGRGLLTMGVAFCLASFVTYTSIGFGLLRALYLFTAFPVLRFGLEIVMIGLLGVFAYLSFRDAYRYARSGKAEDVTLQLPDGLKTRIHAVMKGGLGLGSLVIGGLVIGTLVTALESVCTGQVYVPTLVMVAKEGGPTSRTAWSYLLLYNTMFVVPLVIIFVLTFFGLRTQTLLEWSKKNVVVSKILLGLFFLAMAVLMAVM